MEDKEILEALENAEVYKLDKIPENWGGYTADDMIDTIMAIDKPDKEKLDLAFKAINELGNRNHHMAQERECLLDEIAFRGNWGDYIECAKKIQELLENYHMRLGVKDNLSTRVELFAIDKTYKVREEHDFFMDTED